MLVLTGSSVNVKIVHLTDRVKVCLVCAITRIKGVHMPSLVFWSKHKAIQRCVCGFNIFLLTCLTGMHSDKYLTWLLSVLIFFISSSAKYLYLVLFQYFGKEK